MEFAFITTYNRYYPLMARYQFSAENDAKIIPRDFKPTIMNTGPTRRLINTRVLRGLFGNLLTYL